MAEPVTAYPLQWPPGWRRTEAWKRSRASFGRQQDGVAQAADGTQSRVKIQKALTVADSIQRVLATLTRMGLSRDQIVVSTNVALRLDGLPRSNTGEPPDPGTAVYWRKGKTTRCMAIDRYDRVADNLAAIAATLEAMRSIERHGGAEILDRAFTGFTALPAPEQPWQVLGLETSNPTMEQVEEAYRALAMKHHPDRGGDPQQMARINAARDDIYERMKPT